MGTSLFAITNTKQPWLRDEKKREEILKDLTKLKLSKAEPEDSLEGDEWYCDDMCTYEDEPNSVYLYSPSVFWLALYENIAVVLTIYKYSFFYYDDYDYGYYLQDFRKELFQIVQVLGGTEVIFLADNGCDKLSTYLDMAQENTSYDEIKKAMFEELGQPITDYKTTQNLYSLSYENTTEFFLDDFSDLKK